MSGKTENFLQFYKLWNLIHCVRSSCNTSTCVINCIAFITCKNIANSGICDVFASFLNTICFVPLLCFPIFLPSPSHQSWTYIHLFLLPAQQAEPQGRHSKNHCGSRRWPLEKTSRNYKHTIILTGPSQMTTFTTSTMYTHPSQRQSTDSKHGSVAACRLCIVVCAKGRLWDPWERKHIHLEFEFGQNYSLHGSKFMQL